MLAILYPHPFPLRALSHAATDFRLASPPLVQHLYSLIGCHLYLPDLQKLSLGALNELLEETECMIKDYSETLIQELAYRDELEYEKELKNQFISLLLSIQVGKNTIMDGLVLR